MFAWLVDWLHLLTRWFHLVVGAAWIGASFYFNWLNNHVRPVEDPTGRLAGGLWAVHGGAFYEVRKFKGAPETLPDTLHWFKYEAYLTWVSGVTLLLLVYWMQAGATMVPAGSTLDPALAAAIGVGSLVVGWLVYDGMCRSPLAKSPPVFAGLGFALLTASAWGLSEVFTARAAYIHLGAMMGTMMALNVFFVIIPGQRAMVDAMSRGEEPDVSRGAAGSTRSLHNNYFTLPVLFIMVSNHFPFTYGHSAGWAVLAGISVIGAAVRHWFNLRGKGELNAWILPVAAVAMAGLAFVSHGPRASVAAADAPPFAEVQAIINSRCVTCHAPEPVFPAYTEPPLGLDLTQPEAIAANAEKIHAQAVATQVMPLGNVTQITDDERALLGRWIDAGAPLP
ncbi:MAG: putative membrane protein [Myxococcota bacterium]|jgi:uncharacterized membrane protein